MERTKPISKKQASAILSGDWHLRETHPVCRVDNFVEETQWNKVDFISNLQKKHDCPVLHSGDLFDYWKPSPALLAKTIQHLPKDFFTAYGNHDLPQHNLDLAYKSGIYCLEQARVLSTQSTNIFEIEHWNQTPQNINCNVLIWHVSTYQGREPYPGCPDPTAAKLLRKYPQYNLILTGDNHTPFIETYEERLLVNPGSIFRMDADQINHRPRVYLWYAETNTVEPVYLLIETDIISREHIEIKKERDGRIEVFVSQLNGNWSASLSFEDNLQAFEKKNDVRKSVMEIVYKSIEI